MIITTKLKTHIDIYSQLIQKIEHIKNLNNTSGVAEAMSSDVVSKDQMLPGRRHTISILYPHLDRQLFCIKSSNYKALARKGVDENETIPNPRKTIMEEEGRQMRKSADKSCDDHDNDDNDDMLMPI